LKVEIRRYIDVSEKLRRMMEDAEKQANEIVAQAEREAEKIVAEATEEAKNISLKAESGEIIDAVIKGEERKAEEESKSILAEYEKKLSTFREIPPERFKEATELVLRKVLP
jgi:vacuolar-type H+-ATPase subunit H